MRKRDWIIVAAIALACAVVGTVWPRQSIQSVGAVPFLTDTHIVQHDTFMVYDRKTWVDAVNINEDQRLIAEGRMVTIRAGTKVTLLNVVDDSWLVRVETGLFAGDKGYIKYYAFNQ